MECMVKDFRSQNQKDENFDVRSYSVPQSQKEQLALCRLFKERSNPCSSLSPPCFTEEDRFSLEALRMIHKQMDDDKDGGIEVDESDEFIASLEAISVEIREQYG
ncbi:hypothetical protein IHE44_0012948 [Lamprotornis superbus]|uniref:STIM1/2 EF-hand domain-containing protein n=1 Tax=Lamprotornis superbus TaxID=245042 RepID=A0A835NPM5_9PASS|nr:hypothetical protein IHE44_0012948 [Lamprotornis superbus]